jgi:hypothetical protein
MNGSLLTRKTLVALVAVLVCLNGCSSQVEDGGNGDRGLGGVGGEGGDGQESETRSATAQAEDVDAAKKLLDGLGANAAYTILPGDVMTEIAIRDATALSAEDIALLGRLTDLDKLQIFDFRALNDEMVSQLTFRHAQTIF